MVSDDDGEASPGDASGVVYTASVMSMTLESWAWLVCVWYDDDELMSFV